MLRLAAISCLLLLFGIASAANTDSLSNVLAQTTDSTERLGILHRLASAHRYSDPEKAMNYAREELEIARAVGNDTFQLKALGRMSSIFLELNELPRALEYAMQIEQLAQKFGNRRWLGNAYNTIGNIYYLQKERDKSRNYYERSLAIRREQQDSIRVAGSLNNIAKVLTALDDYEATQAYLEEAIRINKSVKNWRWLSFNYYNLGMMELRRKNFPAGETYLRQSIAIADSNGFPQASAAALNLLADAEVEQGRLYEARLILLDIISGNRSPDLEDRAYAYEQLASISRKAGAPRDAYRYLEMANELNDSLREINVQNEIKNLEIVNRIKAEERIDQITLEKEALAAQNDLDRTQLKSYLYLMGLLVVLALALGLLAAYLVHRRNNRRLARLVEERSRDLEASHETLNTFVYRSSHEIRGTITSIQGLYNLMAEGHVPAREIIPLMGSKIRQLEKVQRNLILSMELDRAEPNWADVDLRELLSEVIQSIKTQYGSDKVDFRTELPNRSIWMTDAILMRTILDNLLDNSVVFRSESRTAWCRVKADIGREKMVLSVEDNGSGIDQEVADQAFEMFFRGSNASNGSGLGLYIVRMAVEQLGGTIQLGKKAGPGTLFVIELPTHTP
jgi:signal transduction histidine kinase